MAQRNTSGKKLVASALIAGAVSLGTAGLLGGGAGVASANCPGCAPPAPTKYIPPIQGPGIHHY
ncbi:hypothetical protein ACQ7HM_21030 [Williamsia sp. MIQD14]|uniref:hypothetical protein n=1 Tax=Williamsia sp. MIQD14 TaxID=3425703 RepID=UPI003DA13BA8